MFRRNCVTRTKTISQGVGCAERRRETIVGCSIGTISVSLNPHVGSASRCLLHARTVGVCLRGRL